MHRFGYYDNNHGFVKQTTRRRDEKFSVVFTMFWSSCPYRQRQAVLRANSRVRGGSRKNAAQFPLFVILLYHFIVKNTSNKVDLFVVFV